MLLWISVLLKHLKLLVVNMHQSLSYMNATILIHSLLELRKKIPCPLLRGMVYILDPFSTVKLGFFQIILLL